MLALRIIVDILALKLYAGNQRNENRFGKIIQINKDNAQVQYRHLKSILKIERKWKSKKQYGVTKYSKSCLEEI